MSVSTQPLLQLVVPPRHWSAHCPKEHTSPAPTAQALPQAPQ
jgi:hypothetical protein